MKENIFDVYYGVLVMIGLFRLSVLLGCNMEIAAKKTITFYKKCLTSPYGSGIVNKLSQGIASGILKKKSVFRKFKLTVDNRLNLW